jgi:hypothetical protein
VRFDPDQYKREIKLAQRSEQRGHPAAALRRLGRLRRSIEKSSSGYVRYWVALLHQLEAGVYARAGRHDQANVAYLRAAVLAFADAYASIDMLTNSLWAADDAASDALTQSHSSRQPLIVKLDDRGARFRKQVGDLLNEQLIAAGQRPVIFGGRYPAKVAPKPWATRTHRKKQR